MTGAVPPSGRTKVAVCVSHPIPYFCALYAELAADPRVELEVLFSVRAGSVPYADAEFGAVVDSGLGPLLARFPHRFLTDEVSPEREHHLTAAALMRTLSDLSPEIVVIYGFNRRISRIGMLWARWNHRPVVYISDSEDRGLRRTSSAMAFVKRVVAGVVLRGADRIFAVGDANEAFYRRRGVPVQRIVRVPFPIDRTAFMDRQGDAALEVTALRRLHALGDRMVVLASGKLIPRKRQRDLVAALARSRHREEVVLVLLGEGQDRATLEAEASALGVHLIVTGFVAPEDLPPWYRLADVYAHVSDFDPHPLAVSEAVFSGLPVIVSDRTGSWGPTDDVAPGENGLVVKTGDVESISAALDRLLGDAAMRATMATASARRGAALQDTAFGGFADRLVELAGKAEDT